MRTNTQEAILSAYIASIGKRTPRDAAQDAAELCRLASSLNRLNEIACNLGLTERQERRKKNLQTRIKAVLERAGLVLYHFNNDPRGYAVYLDLPDGSVSDWSFSATFVSQRSITLRSAPPVNPACAALRGAYPKPAPCSLPRPPAPLRFGE
jgi:hypothetical protein